MWWQRSQSRRLVLGVTLVAGAVLLVAGARELSHDTHCEATIGDSNYGHATWSWLPLGTECRWTRAANGFEATREVGWGPTLLVSLVLAVGVAVVAASRRGAATRT